MKSSLKLEHTNEYSVALEFARDGYEPIECAFGGFGSVLGPLAMDHHGEESWREGVALRACRDHFGVRREDPRFVVTGTPDADAVLAIIALAGLVSQEEIPAGFADLVNRHDLDPIEIDLLDESFGEELLSFQQIPKLRRDASSFYLAVEGMKELLCDGLGLLEREKVRRQEQRRIKLAEESPQEAMGPYVLFVESRVWGFDRWYRRAPVVVSFSNRHRSVTLGCRDLGVAKRLFGERGLMEIFSKFGEGWGGRETVGGSPRGERLGLEDARSAAFFIEDYLLRFPPL